MNDRTHERGTRRASATTGGEAAPPKADEFAGIGQLARPGQDAHTPEPEAPAQGSERPAETERPLDERASAIIDQASIAIVDNIDTLIHRAERLKQSILTDTDEVKKRVTANLNHGARILELSKQMNTQLDELENLHRQQIRGDQS